MARSSSSPAASASVILICTTIVLLLLLLIAYLPSPAPQHRRQHRHRRLRLHRPSSAGENHRPSIPFDPVIAALERRLEDKQWEREHFDIPRVDDDRDHHRHHQQGEDWSWEDSDDYEGYLNDEEHFNITHRILLLFPQIDVDPSDGFVSSGELADWNFQQAAKVALHRAARDLELHDKNRDGFVSFQEYTTSGFASFHHDTFNNSVGWWKEDHFNASDVDGNGLLNLSEFNDFQHPADSANSKLLMWLCKEEIRQRDKDEDGRLNFDEYFPGLFDSLRKDEKSLKHSLTYEPANKLFVELDQDNDGFLSVDELKPIVGKLNHSEHRNAKQQADFEISQADSDGDGRLSLEEMIEHPYIFYTSIFSDDEDDDDYYDINDDHDEFR